MSHLCEKGHIHMFRSQGPDGHTGPPGTDLHRDHPGLHVLNARGTRSDPKEQSPASHLQTRDDRRQRLQVRVVPRDASAPGRRELYTSVHLRVITRHARCMQRRVCGAAICGAHRAAECRESPCGVALRQESLDVEALCRYLALSSTS